MEGCYIPFHWKEDFTDIKEHADEIEQPMDDTWCTMASVLEDNAYYLEMCQKYGCNYILLDDCYHVDIEL